jgi:hypothetical protein
MEVTYGERPVYEDPLLEGLNRDDVIELHPA